MSKCDIRITFDNPERTYRGGETVSGEVHIQVNQDIRCNGIILTHYWKTHGRGNTDQGEKHQLQLSEIVPLQAGEELHFPFRFVADRWPLTYHGNYICVDHYVHVAVDVPWAIDPKEEEEYILLPGRQPLEFSGGRGEVVVLEKKATEAGGIAKVFLYGILAIVVGMLSVAFFFLIPIFLIGGAVYWGWKMMIASRVGTVDLQVPHVVVGSGEKWPLQLSFTPKKTFHINGVTLKILAQEAATSGSGTDSTTHRHTLYEETHILHPEGPLVAGELFSRQVHIDLPETEAWSLSESDNKIEWSAEVRIDIPRFPDWARTTALQFVPPQFLEDAEFSGTEQPAARVDDLRPAVGAVVPGSDAVDEWSTTPESGSPAFEDPPGRDSGEDMAPLLALVDEILQAGRFGNERSKIVSAAAGHTYDATITIDRVSTTFGFSGGDERYENGRTVIGKLAGTDMDVQLFSVMGSDSPEGMKRGQSWQTLATVRGWDTLYDRLVMYEVPFE